MRTDSIFFEIFQKLPQTLFELLGEPVDRSIEQDNRYRHRSLLQSEQFQVIYLEDLLGLPSEQIGIQLMQLIVSKASDTSLYLQRPVQQLRSETDPENQGISIKQGLE